MSTKKTQKKMHHKNKQIIQKGIVLKFMMEIMVEFEMKILIEIVMEIFLEI